MCGFLLLAFRQGAVTDVGMKVATTGELGSEGCAFKSPDFIAPNPVDVSPNLPGSVESYLGLK